MNNKFAVIGLVLGIIALGVGLTHFFAGPIDPPPLLEELVADKAVKITQAMTAKLKGEEYLSSSSESDQFGPDRMIELTTVILGFIALVLAAFSFIQKEDPKISGMAAAFGGGAIALQFLILALGAFVLIFLIAAVLGAIG